MHLPIMRLKRYSPNSKLRNEKGTKRKQKEHRRKRSRSGTRLK